MKYKCKHCKTKNSFPGLYCEFCGKKTGFKPKKYAVPVSLSKENLKKTESHFPTGSEETRAYSYKKKKAPIIISIILVLCLLTGSIGAAWHFGLLSFGKGQLVTERYYKLMDGRGIETVVRNSNAAKTAVNEVKDVFGIENAELELIEQHHTVIDGDHYYRLQQVYQDIEVYGHSLVVETNEDGDVFFVSGNYCPLKDFSVTPGIKAEKATKNARKIALKNLGYDEQSLSLTDNGLLIYAPSAQSATLAYSFSLSGTSTDGAPQGHLVFLNAKNGKLLYETESQHFFSITAEGEKTPHVIEVEGAENDYQFVDTSRNIQVYSAIDNALSSISVITSSSDANKAQATDALYHTAFAYDFYFNVLERHSYDNNGGALTLITDLPASSHTFDTASAFSSTIVFYPKASSLYSTSTAPDIVAHEFTHLVFDQVVGLPYGTYAPAIMEGFSDIMGNIIDQALLGTPEESWSLGEGTGTTKYEMSAPGKSGYPITLSSFDPEKSAQENASIISYVAYLIWEGVSSQDLPAEKAAISNLNTLGKLWYRTMLLLPQDADFESCGAALLQSAHDLFRHGELTAAQISGIIAALETVGITPDYPTYETGTTPTLHVYDAIDMPCTDIEISVLDLSTYERSSKAATTLSLAPGEYLVTISHSDETALLPSYTVKLLVTEGAPSDIPIYTWYNAKDYTTLAPGTTISLTGKIVGENWTDAEGDTKLSWVLALTEPINIRFLNESGHTSSIYNDQVAISITSDIVDLSLYNWQEVTLTGTILPKYSDFHRRDLCLENISVITPLNPVPNDTAAATDM